MFCTMGYSMCVRACTQKILNEWGNKCFVKKYETVYAIKIESVPGKTTSLWGSVASWRARTAGSFDIEWLLSHSRRSALLSSLKGPCCCFNTTLVRFATCFQRLLLLGISSERGGSLNFALSLLTITMGLVPASMYVSTSCLSSAWIPGLTFVDATGVLPCSPW